MATVLRANGIESFGVATLSEAIKLRRRVLSIDPHAFIIITKTSEIMGKGFRDVSD